MMAHCRGDLDKNLDDFEILQVSRYDGKKLVRNSMDDSLVPIIPYDKLETVRLTLSVQYSFANGLIKLQRTIPSKDGLWMTSA